VRVLAATALTTALVLGTAPGDLAQAKPRTSVTTLKVKPTSSSPTVERKDRSAVSQQRGGVVPDRVVAETGETDTATYETVGVTWSAASPGTTPDIQIRNRATSGGWSEWQTISDPDPIETEDGRLATDPIWVGESSAVQVRVLGDATSRPQDVEATLIDSPEVPADSAPATLAATSTADLYPRPGIVSRSGWGADESLRCKTPVIDRTIKGVVVHHTAGSNSYSASQSASIIRGIYAYHTKTLGWCDIGYNFLVDKYGKIFAGRAGLWELPVHGAHATEWNTDTMGVSFMGNYETATAPAVMLEAGAKIIAWKLDAFQRNAIGTVTLAGKKVNVIFGHGDVMATACPGKNIRSQMDALRKNVAAKMGSHSPIYAAWQKRGGESGELGSPHYAELAEGSGRVAGFTGYNGSTLYWSPNYGDNVVHGAIETTYDKLGNVKSKLGWPTSDETDGPISGTRMNAFAGGKILWKAKNGGAFPLWGGIETAWDKLGDQQASMGVPSSYEYTSKTIAGLTKQNFTGGEIYWSTELRARAVYGGIGRLYREMGAEASVLGQPLTSEYGVTNGRATDFAKGAIYYSKGIGTHEVQGDIYKKYQQLGGVTGRLGFPTSNEHDVPGGKASDFQGGTLTWNSTTGVVTVTYR